MNRRHYLDIGAAWTGANSEASAGMPHTFSHSGNADTQLSRSAAVTVRIGRQPNRNLSLSGRTKPMISLRTGCLDAMARDMG
jgi:hypothetical protein